MILDIRVLSFRSFVLGDFEQSLFVFFFKNLRNNFFALGTFDSDGLKMSDKGMEDGERLFELDDFKTIKELGHGAQGVVNEVVHKNGAHYAMKGL